ncbi:acyl carrier protein [Streptomyces chrestomyceticus]|uniref:acyl carrier protein n=1 Tax=Streptomyces chrestomyceticus TaxID=68185 RepID=UPI0037B27C8F
MLADQFTIEDLKCILREGSGADESVDLDGDILDTDFESLGYESLAMLETGGRIEREFKVSLDDAELAGTNTPRSLVETVNARLSAARAA